MTDFEQLYNTYFNDVYLYVLGLSGDRHTAEEITSDTFFKAMRSIDKFRGDCDVRVWLCQIAKNSYYSDVKKRGRTEDVDDEVIGEIADTAPNAEDETIRREEVGKIQRLLHGLDEPYREVFMWRTYAELSFKEIADVFGKSENWACVTYHRARKKIQEGLEDKTYEK